MKTLPFRIYKSIGADCHLPSVNEKLGNCYPVAVIPLYDKAALIERVAEALYDYEFSEDGHYEKVDPDDLFQHAAELTQDCYRIQAEGMLRHLGILPKKRAKKVSPIWA
jgi:hypothetical protein